MVTVPAQILAALLGVALAVAVGALLVYGLYKGIQGLFWVLGQGFRGVAALVSHVFRELFGIVADALRSVGAVLTAMVLAPMVVGHVALGRWSTAGHYGRALTQELESATVCLYRSVIGHPLRLVGLGTLVEGFEQRIPDVIARAPGSDRPSGGRSAFEGYQVLGSLPPGGSGAKLYVAKPKADKAAELLQVAGTAPERVVIKAFSLTSGSTLPQIVRESRSLESARKLGLVLEHELAKDRFHYVMPYVPGEDLGSVARGLHARAGADGLSNVGLRAITGYGVGLLEILANFHRHGLWHKDIKPSNIIVSGERVELVDLGLVTPLASAMTLTTHGTEYYRDPELVRLALQGVKVHEVDGVKFDLYSAGAVLYHLVENSFPAHGNLSRITKRCPESLRWIVRRSMADMRSRYAHADEMLADLRYVLRAKDPFAVRPAELPSMSGVVPVAAGLEAVHPDDHRALRGAPISEEGHIVLRADGRPDGRATRRAARAAHREAARTRVPAARRNPSLGAVAALLCLLLFGGMLASVTFLGASSVHEPLPIVYSTTYEDHGHAHGDAPAPIYAPPRPTAPAAPLPSEGLRFALERHAEAVEDVVAEAVVERALVRGTVDAPEGLRVLLLARQPYEVTGEFRAELRDRLAGRYGWQVLAEDDATLARLDDRDRELIAQARRLVGFASLDDEGAWDRLDSLIDDHDGQLDAVVWYDFDEERGDLRCQLLLDEDDVDDVELHQAVQRAFHDPQLVIAR